MVDAKFRFDASRIVPCSALLVLLAVAAYGCAANASAPGEIRLMPASFEAGLIFLEPVTDQGKRLRFLSDSGGGYFVLAEAAKAAGLFEGEAPESVPFPRWQEASWIPSSETAVLPVWNPEPSNRVEEKLDGMLGAPWLSGHDWHIDYAQKRFSLLADGNTEVKGSAHRVPLYFQKEEAFGRFTTGFPRVQATVDGEELSLLLDTGAQVRLTPNAASELGDGLAPLRATSFIAASVFDRWQSRHPDWRVVQHADANLDRAPMILVPAVRIGDCEAGPVWFTRRPDRNFTEYMSQWMDQQVVGALGGSALSAFRVVLSYSRETMVIEPGASTELGVSARCGGIRTQ